MEKQYRLVSLDLDGTFLDSHKKIPARNAEAVRRAVEKGVHVMLATSRPYLGAKWVFDQIGVRDGMILSQAGGLVLHYPDEKEICSHCFDGELLREMCRFCDAHDLYFHCLCGPDTYYYNKSGALAELCEKYFFFAGTPSTAEEMASFRSGKANVVTFGLEDTLKALELLEKEFGGRVELAVSDKCSVDITPKDVSKATTMLEAAAVLGISQEETIAFGDTDSDAGMIRAAGMGVAMANASDVAKAAAEYIAPSNDEEGVAQVLEKFVLGGR